MTKQIFNFNFKEEVVVDSLLVIYFLFLILLPIVSVFAVILLTIYFLFSGKAAQSFRVIKNDFILKIFLAFYLLHVVGIFYSSNLNYGFNDLQTKLTFLIVPIVFAGLSISVLTLERIKTAFIVSSVVSLVILLGISAYRYYLSSDLENFLYSRLSHNRHPTYVTIYFNVAGLFILEKYYNGNSKYPLWLTAVLFFFLFIGVLYLSARTAMVVTFMTVVIYPVLIFGKKIFSGKRWLVHAGFILVMIGLFFHYLNFSNRFNQVKEEISLRENVHTDNETLKKEQPNSTNIRLHLWKNAVQLIGRNPIFGVGTGDLKEELVNIYQENNYEYGAHERPSPHNQFLHTGVILGILGIVFLLAYLLVPLVLAIKNHYWLYALFLIVIFLNCMTESLLEREAGILFFTTLNTCFYLRMRSEKPIIN